MRLGGSSQYGKGVGNGKRIATMECIGGSFRGSTITAFQQHLQPNNNEEIVSCNTSQRNSSQERIKKWSKLTESICSLLDDYSMVGFIPLNINEEDTIAHVLATVDHAINYGEDLEVRGADFDDDAGQEEE